MHSLNAIQSFASTCNYKDHGFISIGNNGALELTDQKKLSLPEALDAIASKAQNLETTLSDDKKAVLRVSIETLSAYAKSKYSKILAIFSTRQQKLGEAIAKLEGLASFLQNVPLTGEEAFRTKFLAAAPKTLGVRHAPKDNQSSEFTWRDNSTDKTDVPEAEVVRMLSFAVYNSEQVQEKPPEERWKCYQNIMQGAYKGDHLLLEDNEYHQGAQELQNCGAIIRGSSHYEKGRVIKEWKDGEAVYEPELHEHFKKSEVPHQGISGKHIKHILFNSVDMLHTVDGTLIPSKTERQVQKLFEHNKVVKDINGRPVSKDQVNETSKRHYIALQFESSADSEGNNVKDYRFYTHRIVGFITYRVRKILGFEKANVGAYGFGVTDAKPVILTRGKHLRRSMKSTL